MTVGEMMSALENVNADDEVFVRILDSDGEPMVMLVSGVAIDPEGTMIEASEEVEFEEGAGAP